MEHHITVQNASGYSTTAVSELTISLMLDLLRHVTFFDGTIRQDAGRGTLLGRELKGKIIGVVGTGAIGTAVIRLLNAFGCRVLAYNRSEHNEVKEMNVQYTDLDTLLRESDIVTIHLPLTTETHHLISRERISLMKPNAILINTARGNVVDIPALADALRNGTIAGAGIDVYEQEPPLPQTHPLLNVPNCLCMPHIGYASHEAFAIRANIVFDHVIDFLHK